MYLDHYLTGVDETKGWNNRVHVIYFGEFSKLKQVDLVRYKPKLIIID